ncbi:DNA-binding transcriptional regulator, MerR family [Gulbenkiania indica]|uniref:DNA-binding transcriptional regulator, MerR family n=1 Tax=Gulbenkiania indica TaxID=375574 RepID=A0A0K6H6P8_9NEIS|nr:MerR family transcriptional regulator [Gulbenkiania indica]CUA86519.1 DNA-binding transcriptional regulator, MerR family [Gulbenkiania indica]
MRIAEVARTLGCEVDTIRYFERIGLIETPACGSDGYRSYRQGTLNELRFILNCRKAGMSIAEVVQLIALRKGESYDSEEIGLMLDATIAQIQRQTEMLKRLKAQLLTLRETCREQDAEREPDRVAAEIDLDDRVFALPLPALQLSAARAFRPF